MPIAHNRFTSATPTPTPAFVEPKIAVGIASASKYSGPGLFRFTPADADADVHVPSSGGCALNTSWARTAKNAGSLTGTQWCAIARIAAETIDAAAAMPVT